MKTYFWKIFVFLFLPVVLTGCIKNDIPYPHIRQLILSLEARGEEKPALIDSANLIATVYLDERVDIESVSFREFTYSENAECSENLLEGTYDLTRPIIVTLHRYYDYQWIVRAEQNIVRYFEVEGQIGETEINVDTHRIIVKVPVTADLSDLTLNRIKLGPAQVTQLTPDIQPGKIDLSKPFRVAVFCHGRTEYWYIVAEKTEMLVTTTAADAWSQVLWAYGQGPADGKNGFQYKESSSSEWIDVPAEYVQNNQGTFYCRVPHLTPLTEYSVRAVSGKEIGNEIKVTTQATADIPDGDFEQWWLNGKIWCPWNKNGDRFWDTGNTGTAVMGQSNVVPTDYTPSGSGKAAELSTGFFGIAGIGKLGAGSIFTGSFAKVDGTNGILDFGRPWTLRPTKLRGYYRYKSEPINYASAEWANLKGRPDSCHIYVALTDWTAPYQIRTNPKNRNLFDKNASYVIGYGELINGETMDGYKEFEIEIDYRTTTVMPSYMLITCAASKYGDYFTGGVGSTLWVDQLSFMWDY